MEEDIPCFLRSALTRLAARISPRGGLFRKPLEPGYLPFEICGIAEVKIEVNGITAPHEVYVCGNLNQKILIGVDFLNGRVIDFAREAVESRVH